MKRLNSRFFLYIFLLLISCNTKGGKGQFLVERSSNVRNIILRQNDTVSVSIDIDSLMQLKSIVRLKNGIIDGEGITFYPNGRIKKKVDTKSGIYEGHTKLFYESGALKSEVFYCCGNPSYYGYEYWDAPVIITKYIIDFGEKGKIESIKIFDSTGHFLRDSFPEPNAEYLQE